MPREIFLDLEFMESGRADRPRMLSLGMCDLLDRQLYVETTEDRSLANDWVRANVLPKLTGPILDYEEIRRLVEAFVGDPLKEKPRFWGYYSYYDWVMFAGIWGRMVDLPKGYPMFCWDLQQERKTLGIDPIPVFPEVSGEHHALTDAKWNRSLWFHCRDVREARRKAVDDLLEHADGLEQLFRAAKALKANR